MTKISELSNDQVLKKIEKYQKLLNGLHQERERRVSADPSLKKTLFTQDELTKKNSSPTETPPVNENTSESFQINFEESEINEIEKTTAQQDKTTQDEKDSVGMTQVLKLSSDQLNEFNKKGDESKENKK